MKTKILYYLLTVLFLYSCSHKYPERNAALPMTLEDAAKFSFRTPENEERDEYQHPKETLEFFGIKPNMTVVEISPGGGYFTEVLAPYLATEGQLYLAVPRLPPRPSAAVLENEKKMQDILLRHETIHAKTKLIPFEPIDKRNKIQKSFADAVVSFNNVHNWVAKDKVQSSFKFFYDVLKSKGTLGIVQHRVQSGKVKVSKSGYLYESEVISMAEKAGFKLEAKSEINANPKDTADYPKGVWTLPPTLREGKKNRGKYEDIGESDRMTLKFIKP